MLTFHYPTSPSKEEDVHSLKLNTDQVKKVLKLLKDDVTFSQDYAVIISSLSTLRNIEEQSGVASE